MLALLAASPGFPTGASGDRTLTTPQAQAAAPQRKRRVPVWASVEGESARERRTSDEDDEVGIGFDRRRLQRGATRGARPLPGGTNEILAANQAVAQDHLNPRAYAQAALSQQDPDLDGPTPESALDQNGQPVAYPGWTQPASMPNRFKQVTNKMAAASEIVHKQVQAAAGGANVPWPTFQWGRWWPGGGYPMAGAAMAGASAASANLLANGTSLERGNSTGLLLEDGMGMQGGMMGMQGGMMGMQGGMMGMPAQGAGAGAGGAHSHHAMVLAQGAPAAAGSAASRPFFDGPAGVTAGDMDSTSATTDMATAAVMAGLRGSHKRLHHEKQLVGSTLRRAQKSLAANGFDHTNGQYGVPTGALGPSSSPRLASLRARPHAHPRPPSLPLPPSLILANPDPTACGRHRRVGAGRRAARHLQARLRPLRHGPHQRPHVQPRRAAARLALRVGAAAGARELAQRDQRPGGAPLRHVGHDGPQRRRHDGQRAAGHRPRAAAGPDRRHGHVVMGRAERSTPVYVRSQTNCSNRESTCMLRNYATHVSFPRRCRDGVVEWV